MSLAPSVLSPQPSVLNLSPQSQSSVQSSALKKRSLLAPPPYKNFGFQNQNLRGNPIEFPPKIRTPKSKIGCLYLVSQTHAAGRFCAQIYPDAEEVCRTSRFTPLAAHTVFCARRRGDLSGFTAIPRNHFQNVCWTSTNALGASNASVVDLDGMRH